MAVDSESRVEIVIAAGVAVLLAWLWFANRARGLSSGVSAEVEPPGVTISTASGVPIAAGSLTIPSVNTPYDIYNSTYGGDTFDLGAITVGGVNIGATTIGGSQLYIGAGAAGSCNCGGGVSDLGQFGSEGDLVSYLNGLQPTVATPTSTIPGAVWGPLNVDPMTISS